MVDPTHGDGMAVARPNNDSLHSIYDPTKNASFIFAMQKSILHVYRSAIFSSSESVRDNQPVHRHPAELPFLSSKSSTYDLPIQKNSTFSNFLI
jgi:hypothetical protein